MVRCGLRVWEHFRARKSLLCVCLHACACMRVCVRKSLLCVCLHACACMRVCVRVCVYVQTGLYGHSYGGTAATGGIYSSACNGRTDTCAFCVGHRPSARVAAGVTWTSRTTTSALWAARAYHATVINATGAIYVIGGSSGNGINVFGDVWVSTNGGADRTRGG
jgi:hypothetical protein